MSISVMNLLQMITLMRVKLAEEDSSNTAWDNSTFLAQIANQSVEDISLAWPFFWTEVEDSITTVCSTTTASSSSTTINAPSTGFSPGVVGWIYDSSNFERFTCSAIAAATITTSAALANTYDTGSYVTKEYYDLPYNFFQPYSFRDLTTGSSATRLKARNTMMFDFNAPDQGVQGQPTDYMRWGFSLLREPAAASTYYTADATTSTTSVVEASLLSTETDYYKHWLLVNKTRKLQQRVSAYNGGTTTLTLRYPITGQVVTDEFFLQKHLMQVHFDTLMDEARTIRFRYYAFPEPLINDWDVPAIPGTCHMDIVHRMVAHALAQDGKEARADYYFNLSAKGIARAIDLFGNKFGMDSITSIEVAPDGFGQTSDARF